jgi:hypothetical protein
MAMLTAPVGSGNNETMAVGVAATVGWGSATAVALVVSADGGSSPQPLNSSTTMNRSI